MNNPKFITRSFSPIAFWLGTEAEVLKTFLVILKMREVGRGPKIIYTGQNDLTSSEIVKKYRLEPDFLINQFKDKKLPGYLILWFFKTLLFKFFSIKKYFKDEGIKYLVVHGDTVSTLMGATVGYLCGVSVIHLEAGLRSHNWINPFPEEIDRIVVGKLARIHFCQDETACDNLMGYKGSVINTNGNVICDTVDMFIKSESKLQRKLPSSYAIVTFHRAEHLLSKDKLEKLVKTTTQIADQIKVLFVMFDFTEEILKKNSMFSRITNHPNILITPRVQYAEFVSLMANASLVMTDGGSNQEELAHLGVPTLIMRTHTERSDGLGKNIVLSKFDDSLVQKFIDNYDTLRTPITTSVQTPTQTVTNYLLCLK